MSRLNIRILLFSLLALGAALALPSAAEAMSCRAHASGAFVCDARESQPAFSAPRYPYGSVYFSTSYVWLDDFTDLYTQPSFDAPVDGTLEAGLLYSTVDGLQRDAAGNLWYGVRGKWAPAANVHPIEESSLAGVQIHEMPGRPFGWVRHSVRAAEEPGTFADESVPWTWRYSFVGIYDVARGPEGHIWYDIGGGQWIKDVYLSLVDVAERPEGVDEDDFWVEVDLYEQVFAAYEGDRIVYAGLVATGLDRWPTNEGLFEVWAREEETPMYGGVSGDDYYYLEDVPYAMFFDEEIALHGAYWHNDFGAKRSHGCVNMTPRDAEWVFYWSENAPDGTLKVSVHSTDPDHFLVKYEADLQLNLRERLLSNAN
ncbi:MAG: L,D-transpeptidase [Candidatus Promineifilaceae bacterium]|nr:L,D-transpeptidase [Candidatus Promineifilaceae bacterium]